MNNISFYLEKYSEIGLKDIQIKDSIVDAIENVCRITVDQDKIKIYDRNLNIDIQGPEKTEIFINQDLIQKKFSKNLDNYGHKLDKRKIF